MGLLNLGQKNEEKRMEEAQIRSENRQKAAIRDRDVFLTGAQNDRNYSTPQEERQDIIRWQQELDDEIEKLKHRLRSERFDGNAWVRKTRLVGYQKNDDGELVAVYEELPPLANELFIDYIQTQVEPFLNRNFINSHLEENQILHILKNTMNDIADAMADGWNIFEIDFCNYDIVERLIKNTITPAAFRALKGWTKKQDNTSIKRIEAFNETMNEEKKTGLFSRNKA